MFADRARDTTTTTGTGSITLSGVAPTEFQSLEVFPIGTAFDYCISGGGQWEIGSGKRTAATTLERTSVYSSSAAGAKVNFAAGTKAVLATVSADTFARFAARDAAILAAIAAPTTTYVLLQDGSEFKRVTVSQLMALAPGGSGVRDIAFATTVPLDVAGTAYMPQQTVSGPLTFTPAAGAVRGALAYLRLIADGVNAPAFSGFKEWGGSLGYDNRAGIANQVQFFHDGVDSFYSVSQAVGAAPVHAPDTTAPTLTSPTSASPGATTGSGSVTTNEAAGTLYYLASTNATETTATVKASGATLAVSSTGSKAVTVSGLIASTTYYLHFVHRDTAGNDSARVTSASFTTAATGDTTAPTLSAPSGTQTGSTTADGSVTTNEGNGTLYYLASTNAVESAANVKAAGSKVVSATGAQTVSFTGLVASTVYYAHYVHRDAAGNDSAVSSSANFTTAAAAPTGTAYRLTSLTNATESASEPYTYTGTGANYGAVGVKGPGGVLTAKLPAGVDGTVEVQFTGMTSSSIAMLGMNTASGNTSWDQQMYSLYADGGAANTYRRLNGTGASATWVNLGYAPQNGDRMRLERVGNVIKAYASRSATPTTWVLLNTWNSASTADLYINMFTGTACTLSNIQGTGLA